MIVTFCDWCKFEIVDATNQLRLEMADAVKFADLCDDCASDAFEVLSRVNTNPRPGRRKR